MDRDTRRELLIGIVLAVFVLGGVVLMAIVMVAGQNGAVRGH